MRIELIPEDIRTNYEIHEWKYACAILKSDFLEEWKDIIDLLNQFQLCKSWLTEGDGRKSNVYDSIDSFLWSVTGLEARKNQEDFDFKSFGNTVGKFALSKRGAVLKDLSRS